MALGGAQSINFIGSTLTNIEGDYHYTANAPGERGIFELSRASCHDACHDSQARHPPPKCLQGTRTDVLNEIHDWIAGGDERILWLSGPAGCGKSAIAQTIAEVCAANSTLGASFFFFHGALGRDTADRLVATIAYQLARSMKHKRVWLGNAVEDDPSILHKSLQAQFDKILRSVFVSTVPDDAPAESPRPRILQPLIVIDGLDECKGDQNQREVIAQIGKLAANVHNPFRFLIVSRPEPQIRDSFQHMSCKYHHISLGHERHRKQAEHDIYMFLRHGFDEIYQLRKLAKEEFWPGDNVLEDLVDKSGGAFVYASTVIKYVGDEDHHPPTRLAEILDIPSGSMPFAELDYLYCRILKAHPLADKLGDILTVVCIADPSFQDMRGIGLLLQIEEDEVITILRRMQSIIDVSNPYEIRCYHQSFKDFIHDKERAGEFFIGKEQGYAFMAVQILRLMRTRSCNETRCLRESAFRFPFIYCLSSGRWGWYPQLLKAISHVHSHDYKLHPMEAMRMLEWICLTPGHERVEPIERSDIQAGPCDDLPELQLHLARKFWEIYLQGFRKNPFRTLTIVNSGSMFMDFAHNFSFFCWESDWTSNDTPLFDAQLGPTFEQFIQEPENIKQYNLKVVYGHHNTLIAYLAILQSPSFYWVKTQLRGQYQNQSVIHKYSGYIWEHSLWDVPAGNQEVLDALGRFGRSILRPSLSSHQIECVRTWLELSRVRPYGIWRKHSEEKRRNTPYEVPYNRTGLRCMLRSAGEVREGGYMALLALKELREGGREVDMSDMVWCKLGVPWKLILMARQMENVDDYSM